jgi:hypothetical protein
MKMDNIFFIVGAQRCGTTYLYKILDEHPQICMAKPPNPEPKFFFYDEEYEKGLAYYENKYFSHCNGEKIWGEKSTSYMEKEIVAKRIKKCYPESKIIIVLRDPVERALSNYFFSKKHGLETRTLEEVFIKEIPPPKIAKKTSVSPFDYLERGKYRKYIAPYFKYFDKKQLKILIFENFINNIDEIKTLLSFLDVSPDFMPANINKKINESTKNNANIDQQITNKLTDYFSDYNSQLENFLQIDLECWEK